jgi:hypothetical protein
MTEQQVYDDGPGRAAQGFVTPPRVTMHPRSTTVRGGEGGSIIIPSRAVATPEKSSAVYEAKLAEPSPRRRGPRQSEEQLLQRHPSLMPTFRYGFDADRAQSAPVYDAKIALGNSPLANPLESRGVSWDRVPPEALAGFVQDMEGHALPDRRERVSTSYEKVIAPPNGGRRRNHANVRDGGRS